MFTGIVEAVGEVTAVDVDADGRRLTVAAPFAGALAPGESVSVSGACLTVEAAADGEFEVFLAAETLDRTSLGDLDAGDGVNLERAMPADGRFDGHLVQGHVDATAEVLDVEPVGEDWTYRFSLPGSLAPYVVEKGSVAVDGVSLTVAGLDDGGEPSGARRASSDERSESVGAFAVAVIPTTYRETTLSERGPGDRVNVEVDVLAKYVERQLAGRS